MSRLDADIDVSQRYPSVQWILFDLETLQRNSCEVDSPVIIKVKQA